MMETFEDIYREYYDKVLSYVRGKIHSPHDAEDVCSAVFEKVMRSLDNYDPDRASVATWIYRITHNTVADYYKGWRVSEELDESIAAVENTDDALLREESLTALARALADLDLVERDMIILRYYEDCTLKEISDRMQIPYRTVKRRAHSALGRLRMLLEKRGIFFGDFF